MDSEWVLDGLVIKGKQAMKGMDEELNLHQNHRKVSDTPMILQRKKTSKLTSNQPITRNANAM